MQIFIPVICYNHCGLCEYFMSLMKLVLFLRENNISCTLFPITFDSLISRARNAAIAHFLSSKENTHILFIDADIEFSPQDVMKLIYSREKVVCAGYAQKWLDETQMQTIFKEVHTPSNPLELCTHTSVHLIKDNSLSKLMEAEYATTGFLLCEREVFERIMMNHKELKFVNDIDGYNGANPDYFYDFFPVRINPSTLRYESEDYGFSRLWRNLNGKIYVVTDVSLKHHGWFGYSANMYRQQQFHHDNDGEKQKI